MVTVTQEMMDILPTLTTRTDAGVHFTELGCQQAIADLESLGLIVIQRPVHAATGIEYDRCYWKLGVTELGEKAVDAFAAGYAQAQSACLENESSETPAGGWDLWAIEGVGLADVCREFGEDPEESELAVSPRMAILLQCYAEGGAKAAYELSEMF